MLGSHCRDALHGGQDAKFLSVGANGQILLLHVASMHIEHAPCYLEVAEAKHLCLRQDIGRNLLDGVVSLQFVLEIHDVLHALDEPLVYLRKLFNALYRVTFFEGLSEGEDAEVSGVSQFFVEVLELHMVVADEAVHALPYHSQALLKHFLEAATDTHNLAH